MKKIDLHIHTISTISDAGFTFSLETFKRYVEEASLDAVAVTNHDVFDADQFREIQDALNIVVFPGIEINVMKGHVLIIGSASRLDDFEAKSKNVSQKITKIGDFLSVDELISIYGNLDQYLVIPHYDKSPPIRGEALEQLRPYICAGEVDSAKKFVRSIKDSTKPTPVLFSDFRMKADLPRLPTRQTFIDCGEVTLGALKACLRDKAKVSLSESDGNNLWQVLEGGQKISTGLNVLIGARSSGKTHTLDEISATVEHTKYIKQFSLVQQSEADYEREFTSEVERRRSVFVDDYLAGLKRVLDDVMNVDLEARERDLDQYVETLLKSAEETDRQDAFSKSKLFDEVKFPIGNNKALTSLIDSVKQIIENTEFRGVVEKHIQLVALKSLIVELIGLYRDRTFNNQKTKAVNDLIDEIKQGLLLRTSATQIKDIDIYECCLDKKRVERFAEIVNILKQEAVIFEESLQGFKIEAIKAPYAGAGEMKSASGIRTAFSGAFLQYSDPYKYLRCLLSNENLARADLYKLFTKISYRILNEDGFEVSGGERSEFRLLQEISDAQNYDILLIDEPESSFDNLFLKSDVNKILKSISETMPVVVVTHNSTVGASVGADYLLYTRKEIEDGRVLYRLYSGYPTDKMLSSVDGKAIKSHEIMMDSLEAGTKAYESRRKGYEAIKG
ncbi:MULTISPECIES: phosphotransferase [Pseudomonas]|uniref:phosphotransferase n=1 Tax=Pseudomonas TaxID=286 RepID=UPI0018E7FB89|nr:MULTISPECIES: phosphotransferase [Pseudomonas]MBJ2346186.1 phosphotransferase [Pseudomonas canavaninivorans]MBL3544259.1 phosphotransferase [Pseudomonas sp. HB05]